VGARSSLSAVEKPEYSEPVHWLDVAYLMFTRRVRMFHHGWGDIDPVLEVARPLLHRHAPPPLTLSWKPLGPSLSLGTAPSPCVLLEGRSRELQVLRISPKTAPRARVVLPPSWGDEGFNQRRFGFGALLADGVELWLLEGPFFGGRREGGRLAMSTVREFVLMGLANVLELRALVGAARADEVKTAVAGFSMAGLLGAQAVATLPWEVPVVAMSAADTASSIFLSGPLSKTVAFDALGLDAKERLRELFDRTRLQVLPPPQSTARVVVATKRDGLVPPEAMERLAAHWQVEPRWVDSGHLGAYVFHRKVLQRAVLDVL
jgi:hypothetical protein